MALKGRGKPRLPWKRGPVAGQIAQRQEAIRERLEKSPKGFFSPSAAAKLFGVSPHPIRAWIKSQFLVPDGPRGQLSRSQLLACLARIGKEAKPFDPRQLAERFHRKKGRPVPYAKLRSVNFDWPKDKRTLSPPEIGRLVNCHPSLVIKAIRELIADHPREERRYRRSPGRWALTRQQWQRVREEEGCRRNPSAGLAGGSDLRIIQDFLKNLVNNT